MNEENVYKLKRKLEDENRDLKKQLEDKHFEIEGLNAKLSDMEAEVRRCAKQVEEMFELQKREQQLLGDKVILQSSASAKDLEIALLKKSEADAISSLKDFRIMAEIAKEAIQACEEVEATKFTTTWPWKSEAKCDYKEFEFFKKLITHALFKAVEHRELFVRHKI